MRKSNITTFEEHLDEQYGKIGSPRRVEFEGRAIAFVKKEAFDKKKTASKKV